MIDHANRKAVHETNQCKALQAEYQQGGCGHGCGHDEWGDGKNGGRYLGQGRQSGCSHSVGRYHNWIPKEQFDCLDQARYQQLIHDHVARGEVQANNTETASLPPAPTPTVDISTSVPSGPITQLSVHIPPTDNPSVLTGSPTMPAPNAPNNACSASMAIITPSPPLCGSTTSTQMDSGSNTLLRQLMSNAS